MARAVYDDRASGAKTVAQLLNRAAGNDRVVAGPDQERRHLDAVQVLEAGHLLHRPKHLGYPGSARRAEPQLGMLCVEIDVAGIAGPVGRKRIVFKFARKPIPPGADPTQTDQPEEAAYRPDHPAR